MLKYYSYIKESKENVGRKVRIKNSSPYREEAYKDMYEDGHVGDGEGIITRFYDDDLQPYFIRWNNEYEDTYGMQDFEFIEEENKPVKTRWWKGGVLENKVFESPSSIYSEVGKRVKIKDNAKEGYRRQAFSGGGNGYGYIKASHYSGGKWIYEIKWDGGHLNSYYEEYIEIIDEKKPNPKKGRIKWYSKGKLEEDPDSDIVVTEYDDFITDNEFREFLIKNDAYDKYIRNYLAQHKAERFREYMGRGVIDDSLSWSSTPEGNTYWGNLNDKWQAYWVLNRR